MPRGLRGKAGMWSLFPGASVSGKKEAPHSFSAKKKKEPELGRGKGMEMNLERGGRRERKERRAPKAPKMR